MRRRNAFTLVELLVVISIIALLLSVLMPALNKAREQARRVVCSMNLKTMGTAFQLYGQDNKMNYPRWRDGKDYKPGPVNHMLIVNSLVELEQNGSGKNIFPVYIKDPKVFYCVNNDRHDQKKYSAATYGWRPEYGGSDTWSSYYYLAGGVLASSSGSFEHPVNYVMQKTLKLPYRSPVKLTDGGPLVPIMQDSWFGIDVGSNKIGFFINHTKKGPAINAERIGADDNCAGVNTLYHDSHVEWVPSANVKTVLPYSGRTYRIAVKY